MGLFNVVKMDKKCPKCGSETEWQSKNLVVDGIYPIQNFLGIFDLNERISGEAYASCDKCRTWTEVLIIDGKIIDDKRRIRQLEKSFERFVDKAGRNTVW